MNKDLDDCNNMGKLPVTDCDCLNCQSVRVEP
jgi:hypothetical protein